jgi:poly-gamma-glutamate synthase PgsB/CapB
LQLIIIIILVFLLFLIIEEILLNRWINSIPLRIAVSGTRGKSSVVRLLASILRERGKKVLAKTTGSEAKYILPDGSECDVPRRGLPSILEQKKLMRKAAKLLVDCIVVEIMSIRPENHYVESQQLLKPNIVLITNVRLDHTDAMGKTEDEIASVYCLDIPKKTTVFIPEQEVRLAFLKTIKKKNIELIVVQRGLSFALLKAGFESKIIEFSENYDLVVSVAKHLGIDEQAIIKGIQKAKQDIGELKIWRYQSKDSGKFYYLVNAFAANDPQSTIEIISRLKNKIPFQTENFIGLLNLRSDRGDRTLQWIRALKNGAAHHFTKIFIIGAHTSVVKRKVNSVDIIKDNLPGKIMNRIFAEIEDQTVIFCFGNIGGNGEKLVDYWNQIGEAYGV